MTWPLPPIAPAFSLSCWLVSCSFGLSWVQDGWPRNSIIWPLTCNPARCCDPLPSSLHRGTASVIRGGFGAFSSIPSELLSSSEGLGTIYNTRACNIPRLTRNLQGNRSGGVRVGFVQNCSAGRRWKVKACSLYVPTLIIKAFG